MASSARHREPTARRPVYTLHAGLDLSRKKLDVCLLCDRGEHLDQLAVPPDVDSRRRLARRIEEVERDMLHDCELGLATAGPGAVCNELVLKLSTKLSSLGGSGPAARPPREARGRARPWREPARAAGSQLHAG